MTDDKPKLLQFKGVSPGLSLIADAMEDFNSFEQERSLLLMVDQPPAQLDEFGLVSSRQALPAADLGRQCGIAGF